MLNNKEAKTIVIHKTIRHSPADLIRSGGKNNDTTYLLANYKRTKTSGNLWV
jgi:hypothetical protein